MKKTLAGILMMCWAAVASSQELLDGVVAIVGDEVVLRSDLQNMTQYWAFQLRIDPSGQSKELDKLKGEVLQSLINDKILLVKAKEDTITVEDLRVEAELDSRIDALIQQYGSKEKVEAQFGGPISKIKRDSREEVRKMLVIQKLQAKKFPQIQVSRSEVQSFFESIKDSLPEKKPTVKLRHMLMPIRPSEASRQRTLETIRGIQDRLKKGESFEDLAKRYSEDPATASRGGDLGFVERGSLFLPFEEAAFGLEAGKVSDPVETPLGFHLILTVEKRGDKVHAKHILVRLQKGSADEEELYRKMVQIRDRAKGGESFAELAKTFSEDSLTNQNGGDLGWLPSEEFQIQSFKDAVDTLAVGQITMPFQTQFGYHLVYMEDKRTARRFSLDEDFEEFKARALDNKMQRLRNEWVQDMKKGIYVEIKKDLL